MKLLLELIARLFGKGAISKTIGSRTNVIKLADNDAKRFIQKELNILEAGDEAVRKGLKDAETLIPDIPKMNDQEILTFTGNLRRLDQRVNPPQKPAAEVLDMSTQQKVSPEGIESLKESAGQVSPPGTLMGDLELNINKLKASGKKLEDIAKEKGGQSLDDIMKGEGQALQGMAQAQREGLVKATANDIMITDIKSGKFPATKEMQQDILQGSPKSLDYFRRFYGEDALEVLDSLGPDLAKIRTSREAADFAKKQFNFEPKMDRAPGSIDLDDAKKAEDEFGLGSLKDDIDDPEEFAVGGRVGFKFGTPKKIYNFLKKLKKQNPKKQLTDDEIQDLLDELNQGSDALEAYSFDGTVGDAQRILKENKAYEAQMFTDYKAGRLDPKPGEKGRKEFLKKKMEEMEMSGDRKLMTPDEIEELEENMGRLQINMNDVMDDVRLMKEKGLQSGKPGDYDKFLEMKLSGELGPQKQMQTIKMELFNKYSKYLDDETMDVIQASNDPQKVAEAYANVREAALLSDRGVPTEEIVDTIIKTPRTKQADGTGSQGLANLLGV